MTEINLGKVVTPSKEVKSVLLPPKMLTKHVALFGASGAGKTGAILSLVEECVAKGVPTILVDIKGDMSNIALQDLTNISLKIVTPGSEHCDAINIFAGLSKADRIQNSVSAILKMVGERKCDPTSRLHAFMSHILAYMHRHNMPTHLDTLIGLIMEPPFTSLGALELDLAIPRASRAKLAQQINTLFVAPSMATWQEGEELDVDTLLSKRADGKTNITIYSVAHLVDEDQRQFALAILLDEVLAWMRSQAGVDTLKAMLVIDECVGILPPHPASPPTKRPLMTLLKQARAFGLGLVLSSQNTVDMDYKALANCETWLIGKLSMKRDREKLIDAIVAQSTHSKEKLDKDIAGLDPRQFLLVRPKKVITYTTNDCLCELRGPMTSMELGNMYGEYKSTIT